MKELKKWLELYTNAVNAVFEDRVVFIGIQGSNARGEATETSDIDVVLILDELSAGDLKLYRNAISALPERDKICGFVSGIDELKGWARPDLFQFYYDTAAVFGSIDFILSLISGDDVRQAVHMGACNIYHMCVHNFVHERSSEILKDLYKSAVFVLQAKHFTETKKYTARRADLLETLQGTDLQILKFGIEIKNRQEFAEEDFEKYSDYLLKWSGELIVRAGDCSL